MIFFKPFIKWKKELESKSSDKWLSDFPNDDAVINPDIKNKRNVNSKFTGSSIPHIPNDDYFDINKRDNFRDDGYNNSTVSDSKQRTNKNCTIGAADIDTNNKKNFVMGTKKSQQHYNKIIPPSYSSYVNVSQPMPNKSIAVAEDFNFLDVSPQSKGPLNNYNKVSNIQQHPMSSVSYNSSIPIIVKHQSRPTFSVSSLDTALLLQDTEALLNDMEKRVYSRKDKRDEASQSFSANISHNEKIPFVDEAEEKEEHSEAPESDENSRMNQISHDDKSRTYKARSPINSNNIRRNNSCKLGISESMTMSRKLNSTLRNQRSCSMIEEQRLNQLSNNYPSNLNTEIFKDYRSKSKPSVLAMNSGIFVNRRGSAGFSSALNSPVSRLEPGSFCNNSLSVHRSRDVFPYFSTNMLSVHRQRFNRYDYGQHSLKYNSNSTTMLYNKPNNVSPPWNGDDAILNYNSFYPTNDIEYYAYNTLPELLDTSSMTTFDRKIYNNQSQAQITGLEFNPEIDFTKKEDMADYGQQFNASGRSSAFSPINSLHQSSESVNNYQVATKSRSSVGLNEQKHCSYDALLVSSVHQYSARLCRYTEEIVHRMRREGSDYQCNSPVDYVFEQADSLGQLKSANMELQETVSNLRSLEKQLQKVERFIFPMEKSGRNSAIGSCTEINYLNQLERINKELKDFVPIDDQVTGPNMISNPPLSSSSAERKETSQINLSVTAGKDKVTEQSLLNELSSMTPGTTSDIHSMTKTKYSSVSKRL